MSRDDASLALSGFQPGSADERSEEAHSSSSTGYPSLFEIAPSVRTGNGAGGGVGGVKPLKVLIACEHSGTVRDAFAALGHDALSCDLLPSDKTGPHYQGDARDLLEYPWDILIAHPPCTHLSVSGARHFEAKRMDGRQHAAVSFFMRLALANVPCIAVENPVCIMSSLWRKPDQTIHPWQFGHPEQKATCLWLKGLPPLKPTHDVSEEMKLLPRAQRERILWMGSNKSGLRSVTFPGIANAMASQWSAWAAGVGSWFGRKTPTTEATDNDKLSD